MSFTFVNKNFLIPQIEVYQDFNTPVQKLLDVTYNANKMYCSNSYVVSAECIYFTDGNDLYVMSSSNLVEKIDIKIPNRSHLKTLNSFLNLEKNDSSTNGTVHNFTDEMNIEFKVNNSKNKITVKNDSLKNLNNENMEKSRKTEVKPEPKPKSKEELELLKLCEETMEIYQNEVRKMKEIELKIKLLENSNNTLLKKQKEKLLGNFSKFKNDYDTFKMINKKLEKKPEMDIPSLFALKYSYFKQLLNVVDNLKFFNFVDELNLDEVLNTNCDFDEGLKFFINDYGEYSKKLNVKFDHSWEDLELETDASEMNNSRLGGV